jgi:hypothetical protein
MKKLLNPLIVILLLWIITSSSFAHVPSKERGDPTFRRKTNIDGNQLRATIFNFCFAGRTGAVPDEVPFEYPKNTKRYYIALISPFFSGEVKGNNDSTFRIVDVPSYRQSPSGASWNLEPVPNYFNYSVGKIAKSDDATTWPDSWPDKLTDASDPGWKGSWNGYFGKNQFLADQEFFYKVSDDGYNRYTYRPDSTDFTRRGLGLNIEGRALEWSQILINDVLFLIYNVQNDGTKDIPRFATCIWLADFVGGDVDAQQNKAYFDLRNFVAWSTDIGNGGAPFAGTKVGVAATSYLETPGNSIDRIDNDGDGETGGPIMDSTYLIGELPYDGIDNNNNGIVDENLAYVPFGSSAFRQKGVTFADGVDNDGNGEAGSPVVTQQMIDDAKNDAVTISGTTYKWYRWPPSPETDPMQIGLDGKPIINLLLSPITTVLGKAFRDNIDNNDNSHQGYTDLPRVTQEMIDTAAIDKYHRYRVPGTNVILYDVTSADLGKPYLNKDGLRVWGVDEGIDEMIDESREDGVDNDGNWNIFSDDVGLDGVASTGDYGEGDGKPTSGVGTSEPGEPHIDKTDVRESDQIGITRVQYLAAGAINFSTTADVYFWAMFMIPATKLAEFYDPAADLKVGDYDLFVSSGLFPLKSGQIERISTAVVIGADTSDALHHRTYAQQAYNENYQFAKAPVEPTLKAVPGDRKVTLYWDEKSEHSTDAYLEGLGALKKGESNFEGYKIYRATDPAFEDVYLITDKDGTPVYYKARKTFDLVDGIKGIDSSGDYLGVNGAHFDMGSDNGIVHSWVDSVDVQNGQTYYYALRAYSKGAEHLGIGPSESIFPISVEPDGSIKLGKSVQKVVPNAPAAGYVTSTLKTFDHITGSSTGIVSYDIVDPTAIIDNQTYRITFEDTIIVTTVVGYPDTMKTKNFTVVNATNPLILDTLLSKSKLLEPTDEVPLIDGFRLSFQNETYVHINDVLSGWNRSSGIFHFGLIRFSYGFVKGTPLPKNYKVIVDTLGIDTSVAINWQVSAVRKLILPAKPVNFTVINTSDSQKVRFAFWEIIGNNGVLNATPGDADHIIFLEKTSSDSLTPTWDFYLNGDSVNTNPVSGDTATVVLTKPFLNADVYEFTTSKQHINTQAAVTDLDKIKVVPNPYLVAATWEAPSPYSSGKAPQSIHFNHLPSVCTIRIYTVNGELVSTIEHNAAIINGSESWDLLTRDRLPAAYGVYIWHVEAPGIGEKIGKFAIIK